jgi:hypothetical protein
MPGKIREFSKEKGLSFYQEHGAEQIAFIKDAAYNKEHQDEIVKAIQDPDTVMFDFSGGDQDLQMKILNQTPRIKEALKQRWIADPNLFVYTTSASAAALSTHMMSEGDIRPGLGWLENIIVDMHMLRNGEHGPDNRVPRLLKQVKEYTKREPDLVGIGVDEATALILKREVRPEGGRPVETMTGTVVASIDDEGKVRSGALGSNRVFLIGKKDCNKPEEQLPTYRPLTGRTNPPPGLSISPDLLAKLTRMPPGQYEGALKTLPDDTQEVIKSALETALETGRGAGRDR